MTDIEMVDVENWADSPQPFLKIDSVGSLAELEGLINSIMQAGLFVLKLETNHDEFFIERIIYYGNKAAKDLFDERTEPVKKAEIKKEAV